MIGWLKEWVAGYRNEWRAICAFRQSGLRINWRTAGPQEVVRVCYGGTPLPDRNERIGGGIIKRHDLEQEFPDCRTGINLLYLVSSALSPYAPWLARQAKAAGVRVVLNQNGVAYPAWHGSGWRLTNRPLRQVLKMADHVFYQSGFCRVSADRFLGPARGTSEILYNAVDTKKFTPVPGMRPSQSLVLLLAGSHGQFYRVQSALRTLSILHHQGVKEAKLIIAGRLAWNAQEQSARQQLEDALLEERIMGAVEIIGPYTQSEAPALFQRSNILIHPQYNDSCPRLVVEAMACGLPVVYSASGGTPELVGTEAGIGIPAPLDWDRVHPPEPAALANAVLAVRAEFARFAHAARKRAVQHFDVQAWLYRHHAVFANLVINVA